MSALLVFLCAWAQPAPGPGLPNADAASLPLSTRYTVEQWSVRRGLPQSSVTDIVQDAAGFIWVATFAGVARFDGERFVRVDPSGTDLDGHRFVSIVSAQGVIYAGTQHGRLFRFDPLGVVPATEVRLGANDALWGLAADSDGSLLVAAGTAGLWVVRDGKASIHTAEHAIDVTRTAAGALWIRGPSGLTCLERCGARTRVEGRLFTSLSLDARGQLIATSDHGVLLVRDERVEPIAEGRHLAALPADGEGTLWLASGMDLRRVGRGVAERVALAGTSDAPVELRTLFVDRGGDVWVGTNNAGLFHLRDRRVTRIDRRAGLAGESVLLALPAPDGGAWLSTYCQGLQRWTPDRPVQQVPGIGPRVCVEGLAPDGAGGAWLDAGGELAHLAGDVIVRTPLVGAVDTGSLVAIQLDAQRTGWIGTRRAGLLRVETGTVVGSWREADGLPDDEVLVLAPEPSGTLLVGTARGLAVVEGRTARPVEDHRGAQVRDLVIGSDGIVWVATYGRGLGRLPPPNGAGPRTPRWLTEADGFCADTLSRIVMDGSSLWINSNRGVFQVSIRTVEARLNGESGELRCHFLETGEGNGGGQVAGGRLSDGRLAFPTIEGLALIEPSQPLEPPGPPGVIITRATLGGVPLALDRHTEVPSGRDGLAIELATPGFDAMGPPAVERILHTNGEMRVEVGSARRVDYLGLGPGEYHLEVRRREADGRRGVSAHLRFAIRPAIHEAAWFRFGLPVLALTILALIGRAWVRTLRARGRALEAELAERRKAETARAERDQVYRTMFEASPGPLFMHDTRATLVDLNAAARELVGARSAGVEPLAFVAEPNRGAYQRLIGEVAADGTRRTAEVVMRKDDVDHVVRVDAAALSLGGGRRVLIAATDVTAARDAEKRRAELLEMTAASRRLEALGRLAAGIAHDFNNVLAALMLQIDMLRQVGQLGSEADDITGEMIHAVERGRELTQRFLVFGRGAGEAKALVLDEAVRTSEAILRRLLRPGVRLIVETEAPGTRVLIDPVHLDQVLMNLVLNAQDALPGTGAVRVRTRASDGLDPAPGGITILATDARQTVALSVEDEGVGMGHDVVVRAFEPFFTTKTPGRGTGMGLAIVHGAAVKAGAGITVHTAAGKGTSVAVHFPVAPGTAAGLTSPIRGIRAGDAMSAPRLLRPDGEPRRALVCDDDPEVRRSLARLLKRRGFAEVVETDDGSAALEQLRASTFDILITDFLMPGVNGVDLIRAARTLGLLVPALLISGFIGDATGDADLVPADVVRLQKPVDPDVLWARVTAAMTKGPQG